MPLIIHTTLDLTAELRFSQVMTTDAIWRKGLMLVQTFSQEGIHQLC